MEIKKIISQAGLKIKKYSPEILMVAGIVGTVTAAVTACKATLKVKDIMSEKEELQNDIHKYLSLFFCWRKNTCCCLSFLIRTYSLSILVTKINSVIISANTLL